MLWTSKWLLCHTGDIFVSYTIIFYYYKKKNGKKTYSEEMRYRKGWHLNKITLDCKAKHAITQLKKEIKRTPLHLTTDQEMLFYMKGYKSRLVTRIVIPMHKSFIKLSPEQGDFFNLSLISSERISFSNLTLNSDIKVQNLPFKGKCITGCKGKACVAARLSPDSTESCHRACYDLFI